MIDQLFIESDNLVIEDKNKDAYDDLIISLESGENILNLLICVCDQDSLSKNIIEKYEQ